MIRLKRAYEPVAPADQPRYLVERLWPRGVRKEDLQVAAWLKDVAPSTALRRWFAHDPSKWDSFRRRYFRELDAHPEAWGELLAAARRRPVTLVYSAHDPLHNNAVALKEYLQDKLRPARRRSRTRRAPAEA